MIHYVVAGRSTRRQVVIQLAIFIDLRDGLLADERLYRDRPALVAQLGAGQFPHARFEMRPVTHDVNKVGNNDTHQIKPLPRGHEQPVPLAIAS